MNMTRRDIILKWIAYLVTAWLTAMVNYYVLPSLPIPIPLLLPVLAVAGGTLEGAPFGAVYGMACGGLLSSLGNRSALCIAALSAFGWIAGLITQYVLRRDVWGHLICSGGMLVLWEIWEVGVRLLRGLAPLKILLRVGAPELICSLLFVLPVYWAGRFCCIHYGRIYHE